jgi:hypothetical protein
MTYFTVDEKKMGKIYGQSRNEICKNGNLTFQVGGGPLVNTVSTKEISFKRS